MSKILIVEDELAIAELERDYLELSGFDVTLETNGERGALLAMQEDFDLIILDIMLPDRDGFEICREIRQEKNTPIIMVSAKKDDIDKIRGLGLGADDYMTKPFNILELKARVKALLRRTGAGEKTESNLLTIGPISLDLDARNAIVGGQMVDLTAKEFDVVEFLMRNANRVYSREALLDTIWAHEYRSDIRTVDVHIRRLREKLEENPAEPKHIMTKWGVGYYFKK